MAKATRQSQSTSSRQRMRKQNGGIFLGIILGLIAGLALALIVASYITHAPTPFVTKVSGNRASDTGDAASVAPPYNPNQFLPGYSSESANSAATSSSAAMAQSNTRGGIFTNPTIVEVPATTSAAVAPRLSLPPKSAATNRPAPAEAGYFLQIGAYTNREDAEQQRARIALQGFESSISSRNNGAVTYYRVRLGPFNRLDEMNSARQQLSGVGIDSTIIRFTKQS